MREVDQDTVERARTGDLDAMREVLEAFQRPVYQTVYRMVGRRFGADVEDITQEILIKVLRALGRFDRTRGVKLSTWIFTFVKNHCFDVLKKKRIETVSLDGDDFSVSHGIAARTDPARLAENKELARHIEEAVASLPEEQRLAFVLRQYQALPYEEIASVMDCSEGTVKSRIHRAKEALRERLKRYVC